MTKRLFAGICADAVGAGIIASINAAALKNESERAWVQFCLDAADEALAEADNNLADDLPGYIMWTQARMDDPQSTVRGVWHKTYEEYKRWKDTTGKTADAHDAAKMAFRCCMPPITSRSRTRAYIACTAAGVGRGYISGQEARAMLYGAQMALSMYPGKAPKPRTARSPAGFRALTPPPHRRAESEGA